VSALRTAPGVYLDPMTRRPYVPEVLTQDPPSPVIPRKATPEELARLDGPDLGRMVDSIGLIPRPIRGQVTDAEKQRRTDLRASAKRGAEATRVEGIRRAMLKARGITDEMVIDALRTSGGNRAAAGRAVGLTESGMWRRVTSMTGRGVLPPDVAGMMRRNGR